MLKAPGKKGCVKLRAQNPQVRKVEKLRAQNPQVRNVEKLRAQNPQARKVEKLRAQNVKLGNTWLPCAHNLGPLETPFSENPGFRSRFHLVFSFVGVMCLTAEIRISV